MRQARPANESAARARQGERAGVGEGTMGYGGWTSQPAQTQLNKGADPRVGKVPIGCGGTYAEPHAEGIYFKLVPLCCDVVIAQVMHP